MTRKDYELLARVFRNEIETAEAMQETIGAEAVRCFADSLSGALAHDNPRFDKARFIAACGAERND
jgi:hypothetical protein